MKAANRQSLIYQYIKKHRKVSVRQIAEYFNISQVTVRRYLDNLEKNGLIVHEYGKAIIADNSKAEFPFQSRSRTNTEYKKQIAQKALPYLLFSLMPVLLPWSC